MWLTVIKFVGETAAKEALKEFTSPGIKRLKRVLFGEGEISVNDYLHKLDRQMQEISKSLEAIELRQIFQDYNRADEELEYMTHLYYRQAEKPLDNRDRQNTCSYILDINRGVSERARRMIGSFFHRNLPSYKTFLQEYSDKLAERYTDIYSYLDKMDTVINHLRMNLAEAILVREKVYADIADKERVTDLALTPAEVEMVDQYYEEIVGPVRELKNMFEASAEEKGVPGKTVHHLRLKHFVSGKYLTAYEKGSPSSKDRPFGHWRSTQIPQLYLYEPGRGQVEKSGEKTTGGWMPVTVKVDGQSQDWKITKIEEEEKLVERGDDAQPIKFREGDKPVRFMFQLRESNKTLDGVNAGRVYLGDRNEGNEHMWWLPIMARNDRGGFEPGVFLLKHFHTGFALDSDGLRVYAEDRPPAYGNNQMKWRLDRKNVLEGNEYLEPGEKLVSPDRRYELCFRESGNLELVDSSDKKVVWNTKTAGKGGARCIMQKNDGHFVMYDREQKGVWATNRYDSAFADSKLILQDGGFFEIINKHNVSIYDTKWSLTRKSMNALGPDEFLVHGDRLVSENQRYVLRFLVNGNLEHFDRVEKKVLSSIDLAGRGGVKCGVQQDTARLVAYDREGNVVWRKGLRTPSLYAGRELRLVLKDNGDLVVSVDGLTIYPKITIDG